MTQQQLWTLEELTARVAAALAEGYSGAPSGRVRDVPDGRTVRWYTTRGLVDPPVAMRGRQALYGDRHLLQLVAVKRRQAEGASLALIQTELAGLPDRALARIAALPAALGLPGAAKNLHPMPVPADVIPADPSRPGIELGEQSIPGATHPWPNENGQRVRFWATPPTSPDAARTAPEAAWATAGPEARPEAGSGAASLIAAGPATESLADRPASDSGAGTSVAAATWPLGLTPARHRPPDPVDLHGIRLAHGVVLLLDAELVAHAAPLDIAAVRSAAQPLLDLLEAARSDDPTHTPELPRCDHDHTDDGGIRR